MIILHSCKRTQNYLKRHSRPALASRQKSFEKNVFLSSYGTTDIRQKIKKYCNSKSNLSTELQLLQPNAFYYKELLQTVLSITHEIGIAKPTMLDFCLQLYANDNNKLANIRNFAENYRTEDSIRWYTKESFVYRCINETLRSGDLDQCYSIRFYVADLSVQLYTLKNQQQQLIKNAEMTILYRGFRQSDDELNILRSLIGRTVAIKSFMSTSRDKDIALTYASPSDGQEENSRPILLEIYVDLSSPTIIAADIAHLSDFDAECEVLFDIGST
ncbi:unnamed protein product, partial [Rotaria sordida]